MNEYKNILSTKNSYNFPIRQLMVHPLTHISRGPIVNTFVLFASPKTPTFVLLFYTFSYFIPTFPKILVLLLSYFSTQGCQKACMRCTVSHLLENTCMQKPSPSDKTIVFSEHEVSKVVVMVTR